MIATIRLNILNFDYTSMILMKDKQLLLSIWGRVISIATYIFHVQLLVARVVTPRTMYISYFYPSFWEKKVYIFI